MEPKTKAEALNLLVTLNANADTAATRATWWTGVERTIEEKKERNLRSEADRIRAMLHTLPDVDGYAPPRHNERGELV